MTEIEGTYFSPVIFDLLPAYLKWWLECDRRHSCLHHTATHFNALQHIKTCALSYLSHFRPTTCLSKMKWRQSTFSGQLGCTFSILEREKCLRMRWKETYNEMKRTHNDMKRDVKSDQKSRMTRNEKWTTMRWKGPTVKWK